MHTKQRAKRLASLILACTLAFACLSVSTVAEEIATDTDVEFTTTEIPTGTEQPVEETPTPDEAEPTATPTESETPVDITPEPMEPMPSETPVESPGESETPTVEPDTPSPEPDVPTLEPEASEDPPEPSAEPTAEPTENPPTDERTPIQAAIEDTGYAYVATIGETQVFGSADLSADSLLYTTTEGNHMLLATALSEVGSIRVCFLDVDSALVSGYVDPQALLPDVLSEDYLVAIDETTVSDITTEVGLMTLCIVGGIAPAEPIPEPTEEVLPVLPAYAAIGDYVAVTGRTRAFRAVDDYAVEDMYSSEYDGHFVGDAIVQVADVLQDSNGNAWYQVRYLYGADSAHGGTLWTEYGNVYVLASETNPTDQAACTVTDYAYSREFLQLMQMTMAAFSTTAMDGFSLKNISVNLGGFYAWQTSLYGSSGKDSAYPQIAKSAAHGTIYATPHYLEGFTVFCLEHNESGPGEGSAPTGPYVLVDMDTFSNTSTGGGTTGVRFSTKTMHAIGWVLRHTYPFMALDRSDSNNLVWSRVAGQFAIREVIKQLEGAQYVRDYWDMDNFYSFSGGAPSVYLTYARWLATNGIARASITGNITLSNQSTSVSGSSYIGSVKVTTDADLIRVPLSVGTLTGNSGGSDASYYYAKSGDTLKLTSSQRKFTMTMESVSSDSEEANFLVGVPSVELQKVLVPTYGHPYAMKSASVTFELAQGAITVTKKSSDGILLTGTVFELLNASGTVLKTATTSAAGTVSFAALEPGAYIVREKTPSQGYKLAATTTQNVTVTAGITSTVAFTNERISGKIRVVKTDSLTQKPLAGATFSVIRLSGPASDNATNIGQVVATITTNASGIAETGSLPWGQYKIQETGVPNGYLDAGYTVTVWIN